VRCRVCKHSDFAAKEGTTCPNDGNILVDEKSLESHPHDVLLGQMFGDEFGLISILGEGGFGIVYKAIQFPVKRPVAIKVLHSHYYRHEGIRQRFFQEARAIGSLTDSSIVKLIRFGELPPGKPLPGCGGYFFIAQEFIDGPTLRQATRKEERLGELRAINIGIQVLKALADAHRFGLIHRDLKPGNIMLTTDALGDEAVKVLDFGVAKMLENFDESEESTPDTLTGIMLGTPNYMAPEQILGDGLCPATDLYAVGVLLHEMLTGRRPFQRSSRAETLRAQLTEPPPEIPDHLDLSPGIKEVILCALNKKSAYRYQDARSFISALREIHGGSTNSQSAPSHSVSNARKTPEGNASTTPPLELENSMIGATAINGPPIMLSATSDQTATPPQMSITGPEVSTSASPIGRVFIVLIAIAGLIALGFLIAKPKTSKNVKDPVSTTLQKSSAGPTPSRPVARTPSPIDADRTKPADETKVQDSGPPADAHVPEPNVQGGTAKGDTATNKPVKAKVTGQESKRRRPSKSRAKQRKRTPKSGGKVKPAKTRKTEGSRENLPSPSKDVAPAPVKGDPVDTQPPKKVEQNTPIREL
jgi:serine/threonine protein kinase